MIHLGLVGYPLEHSLSPRLHEAVLQSCSLEGDYSLFPIAPNDEESLKHLLCRIRSGEIHGVNVTIPHKQTVISLLDKLTPTAQAIGAVNTIYMQRNKLIGHNTDAQGFLTDLTEFLDSSPRISRNSSLGSRRSALILGAGGSARAVVFALVNQGWDVTIVARRIEQAQGIATLFKDYALGITNNLSNTELSNIFLIVNTTPLGMTPRLDESSWPAHLLFPPHAAVYDLVYNPCETKLVQDARSQGLSARTGLGMLIEQAALSFEIWTGRRPSRDLMLASVNYTDH